jgi:hypothetical protein
MINLVDTYNLVNVDIVKVFILQKLKILMENLLWYLIII